MQTITDDRRIKYEILWLRDEFFLIIFAHKFSKLPFWRTSKDRIASRLTTKIEFFTQTTNGHLHIFASYLMSTLFHNPLGKTISSAIFQIHLQFTTFFFAQYSDMKTPWIRNQHLSIFHILFYWFSSPLLVCKKEKKVLNEKFFVILLLCDVCLLVHYEGKWKRNHNITVENRFPVLFFCFMWRVSRWKLMNCPVLECNLSCKP